jgi:DNA invertase Pin-like site-specific DNA recombinase
LPSSNARLSKSASALAYSGAKREGKRLGRPPIADKLAERIRAALAGGMSVRKTAAKFEVNPSTVQRIARPFDDAEHASVAGAA